LPYRAAAKSAIEVMFWLLASRTMRMSSGKPKANISIGPI
jgi:hypothetical protein